VNANKLLFITANDVTRDTPRPDIGIDYCPAHYGLLLLRSTTQCKPAAAERGEEAEFVLKACGEARMHVSLCAG